MQDKIDEFKASLVQILCTAADHDLGQTAKLLLICDEIGATDRQITMICGVGLRMRQYARKEIFVLEGGRQKPLDSDTILEACTYA